MENRIAMSDLAKAICPHCEKPLDGVATTVIKKRLFGSCRVYHCPRCKKMLSITDGPGGGWII